MKLLIDFEKQILILFLIDNILSQKNCEDYKDRKTGDKGMCLANEECCSGHAIENICPYNNFCCFGRDICNDKHNERKNCEHYKDRKTGSNGLCLANEQCCSGATLENICPNNNFCCFGHDKCNDKNNNNNNNNNNEKHICSSRDIITRNDWGAHRINKFIPNLRRRIEHVFTHHTDDGQPCYSTDSCMKRVRSIQNDYINSKQWMDIGHNFLIGGDGMAYEGIGWGKEGAHTYGWNNNSIGISFIGNFQIEEPNDDMLDAANNVLNCGVEKGYLSYNYQIHGHRDAICTSCPGDALYGMLKFSARFKGGKLNPYHC